MNKFIKLRYTIIALALLGSSCFPEDEMVNPHEPGELQTGEIAIGPEYMEQVYYDLGSNQEVGRNSNMDWDIGFESAGNGYGIILNSSRFMYAGNAGEVPFESVTSAEGLDMRFDHSGGFPDSAAIVNWYTEEEDTVYSRNEVYVIDMGINENAANIGYKKIQFSIVENGYEVKFANLDNSAEKEVTIERDNNLNYVCLSLEQGVVAIEPNRTAWTFKISRYTTMLQTNEGENYPYIVFGALLNPYLVVAALDTIHPFNDIEINDTADIHLSKVQDVIGYEWKYYNFDEGVYTIVPDFAYVIRDRDGFYYKLRFVDFYNDTGEKGNPEFEFLTL